MAARNAFYAQSGGVTAVINASACGVIQAARENSAMIANVLAHHLRLPGIVLLLLVVKLLVTELTSGLIFIVI